MSRILILESDPEMGELFSLLIESEGYQPVVVRSTPEAQAALENGCIALVLVDVPMEMLHLERLARLREDLRASAPAVPAILCTAMPNVTRDVCRRAGFEGLVEMPFDVGEAAGQIERLIIRQAGGCRDVCGGADDCGCA
ncbi:MAG: hypothetical protein ACYC1C_10500 [Chloroflexota bacterium]